MPCQAVVNELEYSKTLVGRLLKDSSFMCVGGEIGDSTESLQNALKAVKGRSNILA